MKFVGESQLLSCVFYTKLFQHIYMNVCNKQYIIYTNK